MSAVATQGYREPDAQAIVTPTKSPLFSPTLDERNQTSVNEVSYFGKQYLLICLSSQICPKPADSQAVGETFQSKQPAPGEMNILPECSNCGLS